MGRDLCLEVKLERTASASSSLAHGRDVLIVKADRQEPLVVVRLSLAAEIAKVAV